MVKVILTVSLLFVGLVRADVYQSNCISCHNKLPVSIDKYFYRYLLKYSSEKDVKQAMLRYLKKPIKKKSVMAKAFINRFGVKEKTYLKHRELKTALDIYWEKYKIFGQLK